MGRVMSKEPSQERLRSVMVELVPIKTPGIYVARGVSDVFERTHQSFRRLSDAHRSSLDEVQGVPEEIGKVEVVMTSGLLSDREKYDSKGPCFCMVEMLNTSASTIEIGRKVKIGEGETHKLEDAGIVTEENRAGYRQCDFNKKGENDAVETKRLCHVSETNNEASIPPV